MSEHNLSSPAASPRIDRRSVAREAALVLGACVVVALATTWPLALHLGSIAHNSTDAPFQAWTIDHVQWALTGHGSLWNANIFAPNRHTLAYSDSLLGIAIPLLPLRWLGADPIAQLNVALLFALVTSAAGGYLFGRVVGGQRATGAITAAAFAYGPYSAISAYQVHAAMHVGVAVAATCTWWLADRARDGRSLVLPSVLLASAAIWQMSLSFYPGAYAVAAVLILAGVRRRDLAGRGVRALLESLLAIAIATVLLALPYIAVLREGRHFSGSADAVANLGVDFTRVEKSTLIWGRLFGSGIFPAPAFPGVALLLLAAVGAVTSLRTTGRDRRSAVAAVALVVIGAFLGLGTSGHGWRAYSPYRLLYRYVPGFDFLRAANRAWILGLLGLGLLAGRGISTLGVQLRTRNLSRTIAIVTALSVLVVVLEGYTSWSHRPAISVSLADQKLAQEPMAGGVLYLPAFAPEAALLTTFGQIENVYGTTAHHRLTPNGYSGLFPSEWRALSRRMRRLPSAATLRELRAIDVRFIVVRSWASGTPWQRFLHPAQVAPLHLVGRYGGDLLYELPNGS